MGYGLPAAVGVQVAHPDSLVIDIAGDASVLMTMQEMSTAVQHDLPIKIFILNNQYMGMVRQWQQLLHGNRLSHSYMESLPDFVKLAEAYGCVGIRAEKPDELDDAIDEMIKVKRPVIFDCRVAALANCFPMIPSGKAHNEMLLGEEVRRRARSERRSARKARCWCDEAQEDAQRPSRARCQRRSGAGDSAAAAGLGLFHRGRHDRTESHTLSVDRRQRAGRARPRHRPVLRPRLQHRQPDRVGDRARQAPVAHHHRHHRHAGGARADQEPARRAWCRCSGHRPHGGAARPLERELALVKVAGTGRASGSRRCASPTPSAPRWSTRPPSISSSRSPARTAKIEQFIAIMAPLGLVEVCRTGIAALGRGPPQANESGCRHALPSLRQPQCHRDASEPARPAVAERRRHRADRARGRRPWADRPSAARTSGTSAAPTCRSSRR